MIQFQFLSGKQAGQRWTARRFPVRIGRAPDNDLQLEAEGVWDRHCELGLEPAQGFILTAQSEALLAVNQEPVRATRLRNGDSVDLGSVRLRFWLADSNVRVSRLAEGLVWVLCAAVLASQVFLIFWCLG